MKLLERPVDLTLRFKANEILRNKSHIDAWVTIEKEVVNKSDEESPGVMNIDAMQAPLIRSQLYFETRTIL